MLYVKITLAPAIDIDPDDYTMNLSSIIYYQDKETDKWVEYQTYHGNENRIWVEFDEIPDAMWQAAVAIEDHRFFEHHGVDWNRTIHAVLNMATGDASFGGSTITQQTLKMMTRDNRPYINRKVREIFRALKFEKNVTKNEILELYLNLIPLGKGCGGIQTAAQYYFGKDVKDLSPAECASIIAITNNPSMYGPMSTVVMTNEDKGTQKTARQLNKERQELILTRMADPKLGLNYLTPEEAEAAKAEELHFTDGTTSADDLVEKANGTLPVNSWFVDKVIDDVARDLAEKMNLSNPEEAYPIIWNGGYKIYTTLDPKVQEIAESVYEDRSNLNVTSASGQKIQSGITILDPQTGDVVATVGKIGEKEANRIFRHDTEKRQVGSSIKPLTVYAPAIDAGVVSPATTFDDYPVRLLNGKPWPKNSPNHYRGWTSVATGLQYSINTIAVQTVEALGIPASYKFATENLNLPLDPKDMAVSPLGLGGLTYGLSTEDMAAAYACFANGGVYNEPRTYVKVTKPDSDGHEKVILENEGNSHVAMKESTAYLMNKMLKSVVTGGTGTSARFPGMSIAGKTGTTSDSKDRYFVGYTPYYVAAVWTGYKTPEKIVYRGNPSITLWKKVMQQIHADLPNKDFDRPTSGITRVTVCADSGKLCTAACHADVRGDRAISVEVPTGMEPKESCSLHVFRGYCTVGHGAATQYCPSGCVVQRGFLNCHRRGYGVSVGDSAYTVGGMRYSCPVHNPFSSIPEPEDPNAPLDPNNPDLPVDPNDPNNPVNPDSPDTPDTPVDPNNPDNPDTPDDPDHKPPDEGHGTDTPPDPVEPEKPSKPSEGGGGTTPTVPTNTRPNANHRKP